MIPREVRSGQYFTTELYLKISLIKRLISSIKSITEVHMRTFRHILAVYQESNNSVSTLNNLYLPKLAEQIRAFLSYPDFPIL